MICDLPEYFFIHFNHSIFLDNPMGNPLRERITKNTKYYVHKSLNSKKQQYYTVHQ